MVTLMDRCSAAAIIFEPGYGGDAASTDFVEVAKALPKLRRLYALPKAGDTVPVGASAYPATGSARSTTPPVTNPDKICYLAFTPGTTKSEERSGVKACVSTGRYGGGPY